MELSCYNIKKILLFSYISGNRNLPKNSLYSLNPKKLFIFREMELFSLSSKNKKNPPREISYTRRKWNCIALILKNFLQFLKRKLALYFRKRKPPKNFLCFGKREPREKFFIFQEELTKPQKLKFFIFLQNKL